MAKNIGRQNKILVVNEVEEHELKGSSFFLLEKGLGVEIYFLFSMCSSTLFLKYSFHLQLVT
jgi:hypothetical protein